MGYRKLIAMAAALTALCSPPVARGQVGGGYAAPGMRGEYFTNTSLTGTPAFERAEVRLDFDWGTVAPVGGSIAEPYRSFPTDGFSVRFTGVVVPAFSETYTFRVVADDGARLMIRAAGSGSWTTLIDQWSTPGSHTATFALQKGQQFDIRVEYRDESGAAMLRVLWSAPSVPEEVIDPVVQVGFNYAALWSQTFADIAKCSRGNFDQFENGPVPHDANGWPLNDCHYVFQESLNEGLDIDPLMLGRLSFSFNGKTDSPNFITLFGNLDRDSLVSTYDPETNTTRGSFLTVDGQGSNASNFRFANSDRDGESPPRRNGITNFRLMRPVEPGADISYPEDALFIREVKAAMEHYTVIRVNLNNANQESVWSDRTLPSYFNQAVGRSLPSVYEPDYGPITSGASWEHKVMLCNETGRDLFINVPMMATGWTPGDTDGYVNKLARLIKYGSDGIEPYSGPVANPVYPPLNPNLRVYVELSNEVWNFGGNAFRQSIELYRMAQADAEAALEGATGDIRARPQDFAILNYDNLSTDKNASGGYVSIDQWRTRKLVLRVIQISDIFRATFGDEAMHTRVRPIYEWQYEDSNGTASNALAFADAYFNNGDGQNHVVTPRPVSYYLWGGGGASYYGAKNPYGVTNAVSDSSFETPNVVPGYTARPSESSWTFSGTAGVVRDGGAFDDIPPAAVGGQSAYIDGTGALEKTVTVPADAGGPGIYSFVFRAVQRVKTDAPLNGNGDPAPDLQKVQIFVNGVPVNARSFNQNEGYQPTPFRAASPWESFVVFWTTGTTYYSSRTFSANPGSTLTLRIEGTAALGNVAFIDDVRLASVEQLFADGLPGGGEAFGQPAGAGYQEGLNIQASWALAYGLKFITYEGGWSLGSDTGGSPMQNHAKYNDPRAGEAHVRALDAFHLAGGLVNTLGTYAQWPSWADATAQEGLLMMDTNPITQGQLARMQDLPPLPTNGTLLPARMVLTDTKLSRGVSGRSLQFAGWGSWNVIAPVSGLYRVALSCGSVGSYALFLDGATELMSGSGSASAEVFLTRGIHSLRIVNKEGTVEVTGLTVSMVGAPDTPEFTQVVDGDRELTLEWTPTSGATEYTVRWGTEPGVYTQTTTTTNPTLTLTDLVHNTSYFITVQSQNGSLVSLPSEQRGAVALAAGQAGTIAAWDLFDAESIQGDAESVRSTTASSQVEASPISRGRSMTPVALARQPTGILNTESSGNLPGVTTAKSFDYYFEWSVTPLEGRRLTLNALEIAAYQSGGEGSTGTVTVMASTDGFVANEIAVGSFPILTTDLAPTIGTLDLSSIPGLSDVAERVVFRAYFHDILPYAQRGIGFVPGRNPDVKITGSIAAAVLPVATAPSLLLASGNYSTGRTARIQAPTSDSVVRYTLDGSTPTAEHGRIYTQPVPIGSGKTTLRAIATRTGYATSPIVSATYQVSAPAGEVLVESDFTGTNPGLNLPWTKTRSLAVGCTFSGWNFGRYNSYGQFDEIFGHEGDDKLMFSQFMDGQADGSRLAVMIADRKYLTCTLGLPGAEDLRSARIRLVFERVDGAAPTRFAVFTSIEGFSIGNEVGSSWRSREENVPFEVEVVLPETAAYAAVSGPLEIRLYGFQGAFAFHRMNLREFVFTKRSVAPIPTPASSSPVVGRVGAAFAAAMSATGLQPIVWTPGARAVPGGLALGADGSVVGRPTTAGSVTSDVILTDADGVMATNSVPFLIQDPFAEWLASEGLPSSTSRDGDPHGTGVPAAIRHALGLAGPSPRASAGSLGPAPQGYLYTVTRNALATDSVIDVQKSADMRTWETVLTVDSIGSQTFHGAQSESTRSGEIETIRVTIPATEKKLFFRTVVRPWSAP